MSVRAKEKSCCFCKRPVLNYGNNPYPAWCGPEERRCCDECNDRIVIPIRMGKSVMVRSGHEEQTRWRPDGFTVRLYDTIIVSVQPGIIFLNHGGHKTKTTARHINAILENLSLPLRVFISKGEMRVKMKNGDAVTIPDAGHNWAIN